MIARRIVKELEALLTDEYMMSVMASSVTMAVGRMKRSPWVQAVSNAYLTRKISSDQIRYFVESLLKKYPETPFPYEDAIGGIAVALSESPEDQFAREYVQGLGMLKVQGFEIASSIAASCWSEMKDAG